MCNDTCSVVMTLSSLPASKCYVELLDINFANMSQSISGFNLLSFSQTMRCSQKVQKKLVCRCWVTVSLFFQTAIFKVKNELFPRWNSLCVIPVQYLLILRYKSRVWKSRLLPFFLSFFNYCHLSSPSIPRYKMMCRVCMFIFLDPVLNRLP